MYNYQIVYIKNYYERLSMRLLITNELIYKWTAYYLCKKITLAHKNSNKPFVLGLPTGSTPLGVYKELIKLYKNGQLSFTNVVTFNMDEYVGLSKEHPQSYNYYMHHHFFDHVDIDRKNVHILNGKAKNLEKECLQFEKKIADCGGIDIMLGGVGVDGHIAFNEPGSSLSSLTRIKTLNHSTIVANSRFFDNDISKTPYLALTMGIQTILNAREIIILAAGTQKSLAVHQAIEGGISSMCPITALQMHNKAVIVCDKLATHELKVKTIDYFEDIIDEYSDMLKYVKNI